MYTCVYVSADRRGRYINGCARSRGTNLCTRRRRFIIRTGAARSNIFPLQLLPPSARLRENEYYRFLYFFHSPCVAAGAARESKYCYVCVCRHRLENNGIHAARRTEAIEEEEYVIIHIYLKVCSKGGERMACNPEEKNVEVAERRDIH